jgi:hypothetical protein
LSQDIGESFKFGWIKDFIGRVWKEQLLASLFLVVTGAVLGLVGIALCCIGVYPAMAIMMLAQAHLYFQLYKLYLARGGEPVKMKDPYAGPPAPAGQKPMTA